MQIITHQALHPLEAACDAYTQLLLTEEFIERVTAQGELKQVRLMSYFTPHFSPLMKLISIFGNINILGMMREIHIHHCLRKNMIYLVNEEFL